MDATGEDTLRFGVFVGNSRAMQAVYGTIERVANGSFPVLILGESGVGKELVAQTVHNNGLRRRNNFVAVDCSAISPSLFETEMFGSVKGAYTGAIHDRDGLIESANDGTLFLDEVGNLPVSLQAKLLRVIQEREIRRVGGNKVRPFTGRIIAATNEDIERAVQRQEFREDLYYRLNVVRITVPPLRDRRDDIRPLAESFVASLAPELGVHCSISDQAMARLEDYDWPGNVRELKNVVSRAMVLENRPVLEFEDIDLVSGSAKTEIPESTETPSSDSCETLASIERRSILRTIEIVGGDKLRAARMLGIGKTTIFRKLKQYGLVSNGGVSAAAGGELHP